MWIRISTHRGSMLHVASILTQTPSPFTVSWRPHLIADHTKDVIVFQKPALCMVMYDTSIHSEFTWFSFIQRVQNLDGMEYWDGFTIIIRFNRCIGITVVQFGPETKKPQYFISGVSLTKSFFSQSASTLLWSPCRWQSRQRWSKQSLCYYCSPDV